MNARALSSRYAASFAAARAEGRPLFMPFLTAGYPSRDETVALVQALVRGGAGALELGVPFSDPLADGPTIQRANMAALQGGASLTFAVETVAQLRQAGVEIPITLMGYLNPFLAYAGGAGLPALARDAATAGVDGLLIVDLPPEESDPFRAPLTQYGLHLIYLLAPTSTEARIRAVARRASGFVYLVSVTGVTGARSQLPSDLVDCVARVRAGVNLPIAVGFGLSSRAQLETIGGLCEAAVVGSALIDVIAAADKAQRPTKLQDFVEVVTGRRIDEELR
ncbi:MAG: tryptophan synthase subunit alpha [Chloroflexi bacterium]|nr:tryptophan synthase subunit alpha [Chloroflexota bacterium]